CVVVSTCYGEGSLKKPGTKITAIPTRISAPISRGFEPSFRQYPLAFSWSDATIASTADTVKKEPHTTMVSPGSEACRHHARLAATDPDVTASTPKWASTDCRLSAAAARDTPSRLAQDQISTCSSSG